MIWYGLALAYIGMGGLVAAWLDHQNRSVHEFERVNIWLAGAFWLPYLIVGLAVYVSNLFKASGASKPRR